MEDGRGARILADACPSMLVCSSFPKNFGLYCERVGALTYTQTVKDGQAALNLAKAVELAVDIIPF